MFFDQNIQDTRKLFFASWKKYLNKTPLLPLEEQIVAVIIDHPEYHNLLLNNDNINQDFRPELGQSNPFLHMGLHLAVREQVSTNRPKGVQEIFVKLAEKIQDTKKVEHLLIDKLAECLWSSGKNNTQLSDKELLEKYKAI